MKKILRKLLSTQISAALIFVLLSAMPSLVNAADANALKDLIEGFSHGGTGTLTATVFGNTITVGGEVSEATNTLELSINSDVTIIWSANYWGDNSDDTSKSVITLSGSGTFEVAGGQITSRGNGSTIRATGANTITVKPGAVNAYEGGTAIYVVGDNARINVNGGGVRADNGYAIRADGSNSTVAVSNGTVSADTGFAIGMYGSNATVIVSGGNLSVYTGTAISVNGANSSVTVSGGIVSVDTGLAIGINNSNSKVIITGGRVIATEQAAIAVVGADSIVTINGGFVFAYGTAILGEGNVVNMVDGGIPTIGGMSVVCAWDRPESSPTYAGGSSTALTVSPASAAASWRLLDPPSDGIPVPVRECIYYNNGSNTNAYILDMSLVKITGGETVIGVAFNSNGGVEVGTQWIVFTPGTKVKRPVDPIRTGHTFAGWYMDSTLTNAFDFSSPLLTPSPLTLYAKWTVASSSISNFTRIRTYMPGAFTDINENAWYGFNDQKVVSNVYEYGLMQGNSATIFNPNGNMTVAEAVTVAVRVHRIYSTGADNFVQSGSQWYKVYIDYAIDSGIITYFEFSDYDRTITRAEMACIFSRSLPEVEFTSQNTINSLPDVNSASQYYDEIIMLYSAGVLTGSDAQGTFHPDSNITRTEAAAIISRVILPDTRYSG